MPTLLTYLLIAVIVIVLAYLLGLYLRRRSELPPSPTIIVGKPTPAPLAAPELDRETRAVVGWLLSQAFEQTGINVANDKLAYDRILPAARKAIDELKSQTDTTIALPFLTADASGPKHLETRLTRAAIQELIRQ